MQVLNFPTYSFQIKSSQNRRYIFDILRKKFVLLQPEEWVRQHVLHFLVETKHYPKSLINVEKQLVVHQLKKRYDVVVFNTDGSLHLLVECKAPKISITQHTFDQIAQYNIQLQASYLMITNGIEHYSCQIDRKQEKYRFLVAIPDFSR